MAGSDQVFDKRLKRYAQLVPPKWNVFDYVMLSRDAKCYLPPIGARRGPRLSKSEILAVPSTSGVDNMVYEELESLKSIQMRSFFTGPICYVLIIG